VTTVAEAAGITSPPNEAYCVSNVRLSRKATAAAIARNWSVPPEKVSTVPSTVACAVSAVPVLLKHATEFGVPVCPGVAVQPSVESCECAVTPPADTHAAAPTLASVQR
jgi:hypothetical protein